MNEKLYQALAGSPMVREYTRAFRRATHLSLRLAPPLWGDTLPGFARDGNPFCELVVKTAGDCRFCWKVHETLRKRFRNTLTPRHIRCGTGLVDVAVPVRVNGEHVATLYGGQVFQKPPTQEEFEAFAKEFRSHGCTNDLGPIRRAYFQTPVVSARQLRATLRLLSLFAKQLGESAHSLMLATREDEPRPVSNAREYVRAHLGERITMRDTARQVGMSRFHFCRSFRKATGMPFTEYVARSRVEKAKELLADRSLRIGEVAFAVGFQSIPHFDRSFKRFVKSTPRQYRQSKRP